MNIGVVTPERARCSSASPARCSAVPASSGPAQEAAVRSVRPHGFRHSGRRQRRLLRPLPGAHRRRCASRNRIVKQCVDWPRANPGPVMLDRPQGLAPPKREEMKGDMESLIHHFKLLHRRLPRAAGRDLRAVEAPQGRVRHLSVSDGANKPYRAEVPRAGLCTICVRLEEMVQGHLPADVVAVIGTQDIVFGEVDRMSGTQDPGFQRRRRRARRSWMNTWTPATSPSRRAAWLQGARCSPSMRAGEIDHWLTKFPAGSKARRDRRAAWKAVQNDIGGYLTKESMDAVR